MTTISGRFAFYTYLCLEVVNRDKMNQSIFEFRHSTIAASEYQFVFWLILGQKTHNKFFTIAWLF